MNRVATPRMPTQRPPHSAEAPALVPLDAEPAPVVAAHVGPPSADKPLLVLEDVSRAFGGLKAFDYGPYESAMRAAATPALVDDQPPELRIDPLDASTTKPSLTPRSTRP